jgi:DNA topoisomerase-1
MLDSHAQIKGHTVSFRFKGKSGIKHEISVRDPQLARLVKKCQDLPGQEIFAYEGENGEILDVTSQDVNEYLREISGQEFTAKDFRTWAGTVLAAVALQQFEGFTSSKQAKSNILRAVEAVAKMLGNTPAICRRCYVHPVVLESYLAGATISTVQQETAATLRRKLHDLKPEEVAVMMLIQQKLETAKVDKSRVSRSARRALDEASRKVPPSWRSGNAQSARKGSRPRSARKKKPAGARSSR